MILTPKRLYEEQKEIAKNVPKLKVALERKTHGLDTNDPVFGNTITVLNAFRMYRIGIGHGNKCTIFITSPESSIHIARTISQLQIAVSDCMTFGPVVEESPSRQRENMEGAISGFLIINAPESDIAANALMDLSPSLPVKRGYRLIPKGRIAIEPFVSRTDRSTGNYIWLQFGIGVKWNSQLTQ